MFCCQTASLILYQISVSRPHGMRQTGWLQRMLAPLLFCICKIANHIAEFFAPPASAITALDEVCMMVAGIAPDGCGNAHFFESY